MRAAYSLYQQIWATNRETRKCHVGAAHLELCCCLPVFLQADGSWLERSVGILWKYLMSFMLFHIYLLYITLFHQTADYQLCDPIFSCYIH